MFWQHLWGGSVAVFDMTLIRGLTVKCPGVEGLGAKGWGSWLDDIFSLAQISLSKLIWISKTGGWVFCLCLQVCAHFLSIFIVFLIFCLSLSFCLFSFRLHLVPYFLSVSYHILIFCLILFPYYLPVFISIHIFCLSPFIFSFSVCLSLSKMETQRKWGKDGDWQKIRKGMETDRKWENSWRQRYHMEKNGDRQKMRIKMEATRNLV